MKHESLYSELKEIQQPFTFEGFTYMWMSSQNSSPALLANKKHCSFPDEKMVAKRLPCVPLEVGIPCPSCAILQGTNTAVRSHFLSALYKAGTCSCETTYSIWEEFKAGLQYEFGYCRDYITQWWTLTNCLWLFKTFMSKQMLFSIKSSVL